MDWKLVHDNLAVNAVSGVVSKSSILFNHNGIEVKIADTNSAVDHALGAKKVLVDTAYRFEELAREMKKKADKL